MSEDLHEGQDPPAPQKPWQVYLLRCTGDRLYTGITNDLLARLEAHRQGRGAKFTKAFKPLELLVAVRLESRSHALRAEYAAKAIQRGLRQSFIASLGPRVTLQWPTPAESTTDTAALPGETTDIARPSNRAQPRARMSG